MSRSIGHRSKHKRSDSVLSGVFVVICPDVVLPTPPSPKRQKKIPDMRIKERRPQPVAPPTSLRILTPYPLLPCRRLSQVGHSVRRFETWSAPPSRRSTTWSTTKRPPRPREGVLQSLAVQQ